MKKIIAVLLSVLMLAGLAVSTSAAGEILWYDDFSNGFNSNYWITEDNLFFVDDSGSNPCLAAYHDGVVSQMEFREENNGNPMWFTNAAIVSKIQVRDFDGDGDHGTGFWWRDDFFHSPTDAEPDYEEGEIWQLHINVDEMTANLLVEGEESPRVSVPVTGVEIGEDDECWFTLGWRVTPGHMEGFVNDQKVIDYYSDEISAARPSPFLLINSNLYVAFDDIVVATADYDLFNEGFGNGGASTESPVGTENPGTSGTEAPGNTDATSENTGSTDDGEGNGNDVKNTGADNNGEPDNTTTKQVAVDVTDDKGQVVTDDKGEKVTSMSVVTDPAPADTNNKKPQVGNATATGDATFVVIAAMVATLGCALVIKKVNVK